MGVNEVVLQSRRVVRLTFSTEYIVHIILLDDLPQRVDNPPVLLVSPVARARLHMV